MNLLAGVALRQEATALLTQEVLATTRIAEALHTQEAHPLLIQVHKAALQVHLALRARQTGAAAALLTEDSF